jgi:uncharacterized protein YggE
MYTVTMKNSDTFKQFLFAGAFILVLLILIDLLNISYPISMTTTQRSAELAVVGEGSVDVVPDQGIIDVGISVAEAETPEAVQAQVNKVNSAIIENLKGLGIEAKNIKTANYSVYPAYDYATSREIIGYSGEARISITINDQSQVDSVIDAATKAGANNIYGSSFTVSDPAKYRAEARNAAIKNAKEQAAQIAKDLNIKLGKVVNIVETSGGNNDVPLYDAAKYGHGAGGGGGGVVFEPGSQKITSIVTLYFEKQDNNLWPF